MTPLRQIVPAPDGPLLTIGQLAEKLQVSRSTVERHVHDGMPCLDVGRHHPGRRVKRSLRFNLAKVLRWLEEREP